MKRFAFLTLFSVICLLTYLPRVVIGEDEAAEAVDTTVDGAAVEAGEQGEAAEADKKPEAAAEPPAEKKEASESDEAVITLTNDGFEAFIAENDVALVEFYAPWCGHCKKLAPEYEKAAKELKGEVALAKVDATVENELSSKFEVSGFPTMKFFKKGVAKDYDGGRTADAIVTWLRTRTQPAVKFVTAEELEVRRADESKTRALFAYEGSSSDAAFEYFQEVADAERDAGEFMAVKQSEDGDSSLWASRPHEGKFVFTGSSKK
eukprot:Filipodium_phascolosomae@DN833_c0_g1_i1.p1